MADFAPSPVGRLLSLYTTKSNSVAPPSIYVGNLELLAAAQRPRIHRVSKNVPALACYNFDTHEWNGG